MKVLVVEDSATKREAILGVVGELIALKDISEARSVSSGMRELCGAGAELVVLDMSLPTFDTSVEDDGGRHQSFGGREFLQQMQVRGIRVPVLICTQFTEFGSGEDWRSLGQLAEELAGEFPDVFRGYVQYGTGIVGWKELLRERLSTIISEVGRE